MSAPAPIQERNQELARRINAEALRDPRSPYFGKFLGIIDGRVAIVADDLDELGRRLDESGADPRHTFCIEIGIGYDEPQYIWSLR